MAGSNNIQTQQRDIPPLLFVGRDLPPALEGGAELQETPRPLQIAIDADSAMAALARQEVALVMAHAGEDASGYALCERIRNHPGVAQLPVILFAPDINLNDVLRALQSGVDALLPLTGSPGHLNMHVEQVLQSAKKDAAVSASLLFGHTRITSPLSGERVSNLLLSCLCYGSSNLLSQLQEICPEGASEAHGVKDAGSSQGLRILVAEDNSTNRFYLTRLLQNMGYQVTAVENGREALIALSQERYDTVLMDIQMPVLNGIEALRQIRQGHKILNPYLPVLAITAHGVAGDRESLLQQGFDDYLSKPVEPGEIKASLTRLLGSRATPELAQPVADKQPAAKQKLAVSAADSYVLDKNKTLQRLKDERFVEKLYNTFLNDLDSRVTALRDAREHGDMSLLCKLAHTLKGAVSVLDAQQARDKAYNLECAAREQDRETAQCCLDELCAALETLRCVMDNCLSQRQEGAP